MMFLRNKVNNKTRDLIIDVSIIVAGLLVAAGLFFFLKNLQAKKETERLIPAGVEALNKQEYSRAISFFKEAEKKYPQNTDVKRYLGNLYFIKGKYDDALNYYNAVDSKLLKNYELEDIGSIYFEKKDYDKAIEFWAGKDLKPETKYKLAKVYYEKEKFDDYYKTLGEINSYREPLVLLQIKETNLPTILANLDKAQTQNTISSDVINVDLFKSQITDAKKQADAGKKDFSELIQIAAFGNLNQCKILFTRIDELKKTLDSKKITSYQADYYKGYCLNQIGKPDDAIPLIEAAIKADPTMTEYRESLAKSYFLKGDVQKVKDVYADLLNIQKSPVYYENLAIYLYKLGKLDDALKNYDLALASEQKEENKIRYTKSIMQISMLDLKSLDVCNRSELLELLDKSLNDQLLLYGQCKIYVSKDLSGITESKTLTYEYLKALKEKNKDKINQILDKDVDGLITTYYKAVGDKLLKVQ